MSCLNVRIAPVGKQRTNAIALKKSNLSLMATANASVSVSFTDKADLNVASCKKSALAIAPAPKAAVTVGSVCSISGGTLVVLAASDGPLRTRDGGFILLDPASDTG